MSIYMSSKCVRQQRRPVGMPLLLCSLALQTGSCMEPLLLLAAGSPSNVAYCASLPHLLRACRPHAAAKCPLQPWHPTDAREPVQ